MAEETTVVPWLEDVMIETKTKRDEWLFGARQIHTFIGSTKTGELPEYLLPAVTYVRDPIGRHDRVIVARKTDVARLHNEWLAKQDGRAKKVSSNGNGHKAELVDLRDGSILATKEDFDKHAIALQENTLALKSQTKALLANTEAVNKLRETWEK